VAAVGYLPALLLGLYLGALADLWDRRRLMMAADLLRAMVLIYIPIAFAGSWLSPWQLAACAFLISSGAALFNPARDASVPHLVPEGSLLSANALVQTSSFAAMLLGPLFAGAILSITVLPNLFYFDALAFVASLWTIYLLRLPKLERPEGATQPLKSVKEGLSYTVRTPWAGQLLLLTALDNLFIMGPAIVGAPIFVREELKLGAQAFAGIEACYALGMLAGALLLGTFGKALPKGRTWLIGMVLDGVTFIPLYFAPTFAWTAVVIIIHSLCIPLIMVPRAAMVQEGIPGQLQGRFFALVNLTVVGMTALSAGMAGILCESIGVRAVFLIIGIGGGVCGLLGFGFRALRSRQ
jgi:MFS family permease